MKQFYTKTILTCSLALLFTYIHAQETDLFKIAEEEAKKADSAKNELVEATFKSTRVINGHSVETTKRGILDYRIHHRFGFVNTGLYDFFGLDNATERMGFDYGITDRFAIGIGRSTFQKQMDGFLKYRLLHQSTGYKAMPISVTLLAAGIVKTVRNTDPSKPLTGRDKTSYVYQAIIAKKFNDKTSLQLMPTLVHYNLVPLATDPNDMYSLGIAARQKLNRRFALTAEYYYQFNQFNGYKSSLAVGVDIETGGHVFQLHFTNSTGMTEPTFIHETMGDFFKGDIHFGFNISRNFTLKKNKGSRTSIK
ncbi:MAG: hypothetical protein H7178_04220 [Chitinophagaceae bacterium]|nr:hypothetical protein [Chitinophagaceae bacterium]